MALPSSSFFFRQIRLAEELDELAVDVRLDLRFEVVAEDRLDFTGNLQRNSGPFGDFNGQCTPFGGAILPRNQK